MHTCGKQSVSYWPTFSYRHSSSVPDSDWWGRAGSLHCDYAAMTTGPGNTGVSHLILITHPSCRAQVTTSVRFVLGICGGARSWTVSIGMESTTAYVPMLELCVCVCVYVCVCWGRGGKDSQHYNPCRVASDASTLCFSSVCMHSLGQRSFSSAASSVWNSLPFKVRSSNILTSFKASLKFHLFKLSYWH